MNVKIVTILAPLGVLVTFIFKKSERVIVI